MSEVVMDENLNTAKNIKSVLIADDTKSIQTSLKFIVESLGCKVWISRNGEDAIKKYKQHKPNLVFMDIKMPAVNGVEAIKQIKAFDKNANIIIITAFSGDKNFRELIKDDPMKFIDKPFEIAEIKSCL